MAAVNTGLWDAETHRLAWFDREAPPDAAFDTELSQVPSSALGTYFATGYFATRYWNQHYWAGGGAAPSAIVAADGTASGSGTATGNAAATVAGVGTSTGT